MTTHYEVLGVSEGAGADEIKRAYYRRARAYHPDAHAGSTQPVLQEAARAMAALNAAWNVLRDPELRLEYDRALEAGRDAARSARTRDGARRRRARHREAPPLALGPGFRYWMGSCGVTRQGDRARFSLAVDGKGADLKWLRRLAPESLYALHAAGSDIGDAQLVHLRGMAGLRHLDLSGTKVGDAGLLHLQDLDGLEELQLWDTAVTDAGLVIVGRLLSLRHLGLGNTRVTDAGLAPLAELRGLRVLQLWRTDVTGHGLEHLHGLLDLEVIALPGRVRGRYRKRLRAALPQALIV